MKKIPFLFFTFFLCFFPWLNFAANNDGLTDPPQPTTCIIGTFTKTGTANWSNVALNLKNTCGKTVDFQNAYFTFENTVAIDTNFWGTFGKLTYPDNNLHITSQPSTNGKFLASFSIHIPEKDWANSKLENNESITLFYGVAQAAYDAKTLKVYLPNNGPVQTAEINFTNQSTKPANVTENYAVINLKSNGQLVKSLQLPWASSQLVQALNPGTYAIEANNVTSTQGNTYQGSATPATIVLTSGQKASSLINYTLLTQFGKIKIQTPALPNVIAGYANPISISLTNTSNGSTTNKSIAWNTNTTLDQLANQVRYSFTTPEIIYNNYRCTGSLTPETVVSDAQTPPTVTLSYLCMPLSPVSVALNVSGLNSNTSTVDVTFTPSDGSSALVKRVNLTSGSGNDSVSLTDNTLYNVSSTSIPGFSVSFQPQPLLAKANASETITYKAITESGGRTIGYIPGWKQPPTATELANAGYTHVLIAFGVFSTTQPGIIVPAFDTVSKSYINSLHQAGIKVILSLGGALTSLPNTTVDFHQILQLSGNPTTFQQTFVKSVKDLAAEYSFDGIDIDIEHGINGAGPFQAPTGDIDVLAKILNQLHADLPNFLITMAPQSANISATSGFDGVWGNYSALVMQTYKSLTWVGIQLYNTGCMFGIDHVCYDSNQTNTPNFSVAMATDLLASWPQTDSSGRPTGFRPYISYLRADQVVLGYPSPNAQGQSDGAPVVPASTIKRAIQCLKTGVAGPNSCGSYVPPKAYGLIGGVFNWEVTYDQSNQFKFARDLKTCVTTGDCG